ncbi:MAG TPA: HAD family phosphatase [Anaerolineales bacterium]|nr:HAD family phosphatase [Anaerolineales bacterium]
MTPSEPATPIRAVIWDFGGVLVRTEDPAPRRAWEERLGLPPGGFEQLVFRSEIARSAALGEVDDEDVWRWVRDQLGVPESEQDTLVEGFYGGDALDEELIAFIRALRPARRTGLLSNAYRSLRPALSERFPIADAFDAIVVSAEEGVMKPDPRIYTIALQRLGIEPGEAVFIDDFDENCEGARAVGMHAVRFESSTQVVGAVASLLGGAVS